MAKQVALKLVETQTGLNDPGMIRAIDLRENINKLIRKYGNGLYLYFDAGHNNITVSGYRRTRDKKAHRFTVSS